MLTLCRVSREREKLGLVRLAMFRLTFLRRALYRSVSSRCSATQRDKHPPSFGYGSCPGGGGQLFGSGSCFPLLRSFSVSLRITRVCRREIQLKPVHHRPSLRVAHRPRW